MPRCFDFECPKCKYQIEVIFLYPKNIKKTIKCSRCGSKMDRLFPIPHIVSGTANNKHNWIALTNPDTFDPVTGNEMDKYEMDYWKNNSMHRKDDTKKPKDYYQKVKKIRNNVLNRKKGDNL